MFSKKNFINYVELVESFPFNNNKFVKEKFVIPIISIDQWLIA